MVIYVWLFQIEIPLYSAYRQRGLFKQLWSVRLFIGDFPGPLTASAHQMHPRQLPPTRLLLFHKILWSNFSSRASDEIQQLEHCLYCSSPWYLSRLHEHHPDSMTAHVALLPTMKSHKINNCWLLNLFHAQCDFVCVLICICQCEVCKEKFWGLRRGTSARLFIQFAKMETAICSTVFRDTFSLLWNNTYCSTHIYGSPGGNFDVKISSKKCLYCIGIPKFQNLFFGSLVFSSLKSILVPWAANYCQSLFSSHMF